MPGLLNDADRRTISQLVSSRVGLVRSLQPYRPFGSEPGVPVIYTALMANWDLRADDDDSLVGVGKGHDSADAIRGALGEAVERYCCGIFDISAMPYVSERELRDDTISPADLVLYSDQQYDSGQIRYPRYSRTWPLHWALGHNLTDARPIHVPASSTYLAYRNELREETFCYNTSNGLAAGRDLPSAILGGLCELVERDGYLMSWMHRLPAPRVTFDRASAPVPASIREHYSAMGVELQVFDVSSDIEIPVMLALAVDRSGRSPAAVVGLGCDLDPAVALTKAVFELCQGRAGEGSRHRRRSDAERIRSFGEVRQIRDHSALFAELAFLPELDFLLNSAQSVALECLPSYATGQVDTDLALVVDRLRRVGSTAAYVDVTTPDVAEAGLHVVRTVATHLQPIHFGYLCERFGDRRVLSAAPRVGSGRISRHESLNRCPHPLP